MKLTHFVITSLTIVLIYTIVEFIAGCYDHPHDGLTPYVYGFWAGEVVCTALIKIFKKENNNEEETNES